MKHVDMNLMKQISATRDEIIEMLKNGEIVFATDLASNFKDGLGLVLKDGSIYYTSKDRAPYDVSIDYGSKSTSWFVEYPTQENTTPEEFEFREGDLVEHVLSGEVFTLYGHVKNLLHWPERDILFYKSGRVDSSHKYPSIRLIKRPKKQKKVEIVMYANIYPHREHTYKSEEDARAHIFDNPIAVAVEMRGHYFIEEDE